MVAIYSAGSGSYATPSTATLLSDAPAPAPPGTLSVPCGVSSVSPGDWLVACISWRTLTSSGVLAANAPTMSVADDVHNWWEPLVPGVTTSTSGFTRCAIWVAPAVRVPSTVYVAPSDFAPAIACEIYGVTGAQPWFTATAVTGNFANASTSLSVSAASPAVQAVFFTVSASDNTSDTISLGGGAGWGTVTQVTNNNGSDHTADINCSSANQVTSSAGTVTAAWSSTGSVDFSAIVGGFLVAATALTQRSPAWPVTIFECSPGNGLQTTPDTLSWTAMTAASMKLSITQGRQYEAAQLATGEGTLLIDNPLGAFIPPGSGSFSGINSGTPVRMRTAWPGGAWQVQFSGNGVTANAQITTGNIFTVIPGVTYTASAWLASTPATATGVAMLIVWRTAGGALISSVSSGAVTSSAATYVTASGAAPGTAALANILFQAVGTPLSSVVFSAAAAPSQPVDNYITIPPGVTWTGQNNATPTTLAPWLASPLGPPNVSPWYIPYSGFIERLPQQWDENLRGVVEATITDIWFGANFVPQPVLFQEILNDDPYAYWPCIDPAGSLTASNLVPGNVIPLTLTTSKYGSASVAEAFGQNAQALLGAQSTAIVSSDLRVTSGGGMWQITLPNNNPAGGYCLAATDPNFPALSGGVTVEVWFQYSGQANIACDTVILAYTNKGEDNGWVFNIFVDTTAHPSPLTLAYGGGPGTATTVNIGNGSTDYSAMTLPSLLTITLNATTWTTYLDGSQTATGSHTFGVPRFTSISVNGSPAQSGQGAVLLSPPYPSSGSGFIGHVAVYPVILAPARILTHFQAGFTAMQQEPAAFRIERLLQMGNITGRRIILQETSPDQTNVVSCQDVPGSPVSSAVDNLAADLLPGMFLVAPTGDMFYMSKQYAWNQAVKWVLGEDAYSTENPFGNDITFDYDPSRVINQIQLTQLDNQDVIVPSVTAIETASQVQYGTISDITTGYLWGDALVPYNYGAGLYDIANWLATTYANPSLRLTTVKVDASSNPANWPFILGASPGDMVTVNRRSLGQATIIISVTGRITQVERNFEFSVRGVSASVNCVIDPAPEEDALTLNDPVRGLLNGTNVLAW